MQKKRFSIGILFEEVEDFISTSEQFEDLLSSDDEQRVLRFYNHLTSYFKEVDNPDDYKFNVALSLDLYLEDEAVNSVQDIIPFATNNKSEAQRNYEKLKAFVLEHQSKF